MKQIPILTAAEVTHAYSTKKQDYWSGYLAMYSSWLGGITKDPAFMQVPVDDHMVHRGDGVFEAIKTINGKVFLFHEHLDRLEKSAAQLLLPIPFPRKELESIVLETLRAAGEPNALIRLYVSRGPGGFTTNPYECVSSQLYIVVTKFKPIAAEKYLKGVKVAISKIPIKDPWFARVKSCNYLHNVLMKRESVDLGLDFTLSVTQKGWVGEGSTENVALISKDGFFCYPHLNDILRGTTMMKVAELMEPWIAEKRIAGIKETHLQVEDFLNAKEAFMIGTTLDVLPITEFNGKPLGGGNVGPLAPEMNALLKIEFTKGIAF